MFERSVNICKENNIFCSDGLTAEELMTIEKIYEITIPNQLKDFLKITVPLSNGFYNWKVFSKENVDYIKQTMARPVLDIYDSVGEIEWNKLWGNEPETDTLKGELIRERLLKAPKVIPFFAHRFIPSGYFNKCPIISIHNTDIIYYGSSIDEYFEIEYGYKRQGDIEFDKIDYIPFWSEIM